METLLFMCPQNSFFSPNGSVYMGEKAETLRIRLEDFLPSYAGPKVFFREKHAEADSFFVRDKTHSIVNSFDFNVFDFFKKHADVFFDKDRYSGFYGTSFEDYLKKNKVTSAILVGVETHTSILYTAEELRNRGIEVSLTEPLIASRDDYMHNAALSIMVNSLGVRLNA